MREREREREREGESEKKVGERKVKIHICKQNQF